MSDRQPLNNNLNDLASEKRNDSRTGIRVAHLVSHPIQYFAPLYRAITKRPEVSLTVYFYSGESLKQYFDREFGRAVEWDVPLLEGYRSVLTSEARRRKIAAGFDWRPNWAILRELWVEKYDVIWLHGYASVNSWLGVLISIFTGAQVLLREEQTLLTARSSLKSFSKRQILPILYRRVSGLYIGENSRRFFELYGTRPDRLYPARYCVDNQAFRERHVQLLPERSQIRAKFGIESEAPVILFSGKLIDKKQPELLLESFRRLRREIPCHLLFAGDGPLRTKLEAKVREEHIPSVHWAGFLNQTELPLAYTAADIFVLPSAYQETWGLVVNEAMNFGLPIIVSDHVGCGSDLVREGENGHIFKSGDPAALEAALRKVMKSSDRRRSYGARSLEIIANYTIDACASQIIHACQDVKGLAAPVEADLLYSDGSNVHSR